jgi:DNA-directed RNA polymerase subunit N (RpoN/RPB10)
MIPLDLIPQVSPMLRPICRCVCGGAIAKCYSHYGTKEQTYWGLRHVARNFLDAECGQTPPTYCFLWATWEIFGKLHSLWLSRVRIPLRRLAARLQPKKYPHRCFYCGRQAIQNAYDYDGKHWPAHCFREDCLDEWGPR